MRERAIGPNAVPGRWVFELFVSGGYFRDGGPNAPFEKTISFVPPNVGVQSIKVDGRTLFMCEGTAPAGAPKGAGFWIITAVAPCRGVDVLDDVLAAAELVLDAVVLSSSARCTLHSVKAWHAEPWPTSATELQGLLINARDLPRYRTTATDLGLLQAPAIPLPENLGDVSPRSRSAMRWYCKSTEATSDVDQFAFLWIAAEIASVGLRPDLEKSPFKGPCGHEISNCPDCGTSITKVAGGDMMRAVLVDAGVDAKLAKTLWHTRQMFHGSNPLTSSSLRRLPEHINALRPAVQRMLLTRIGSELGTPMSATPPPRNVDARGIVAIVSKITPEQLAAWERLGLQNL